MYLTARLFGILVYVLALFIVAVLILLDKKISNRPVIVGYIFVLSVIAFFFVPPESFDLYRLIGYMKYYSKFTWAELFEAIKNLSAPLVPLYYKLISYLGYDGFLAGITVFITFSNCFYILSDSQNRFNSTNLGVMFALLFIMASGVYGETIDGIRSMMAFSIIAVCVYSEILKNGSFLFHIPLYLIASLLHKAALVLVAIRVLYWIFEKDFDVSKKVKKIGIVAIGSMVALVFLKNNIIQAIKSAEYYLTSVTYSYVWEVITSCIFIALLFVLIKLIRPLIKNENNKNQMQLNNYINFIIFILLISIAFLPFEYSIFHRFYYFTIMLSPPLFCVLHKKDSLNEKHNFEFLTVIVFVLIIICLRGKICSMKFWV